MAAMINEKKLFKEADVAAVYNRLGPIDPKFLIGDWTGGDLDTGHAAQRALRDLKWAGKCFHSNDDVDPIMVYDDQNNRVWNKDFGHAIVNSASPSHRIVKSANAKKLREVKYRSVVSTAMIYDQFPIIDHFRYVDNDTVAGAMDTKQYGTEVHYFFLKRIK